MREIEHWSEPRTVLVAESVKGTLATVDPGRNLLRGNVLPWPAPELLQKLYASHLWQGKTREDDRQARIYLGHYSDVQSLNSEDAITWSFFGPLIYGPAVWREHFVAALFLKIGLPKPNAVAMWLWRRIPHPEKPSSIGGPEIDFGIQTDTAVVFGEAKWNSGLGKNQGLNKDRSQFDLRLNYCAGLGRKALPGIQHWAILGVGRSANVLDCTNPQPLPVRVQNLSWSDLLTFMPSGLQPELSQYLAWKDKYSSKRRAPKHTS
jgi:hypothetical protein